MSQVTLLTAGAPRIPESTKVPSRREQPPKKLGQNGQEDAGSKHVQPLQLGFRFDLDPVHPTRQSAR